MDTSRGVDLLRARPLTAGSTGRAGDYFEDVPRKQGGWPGSPEPNGPVAMRKSNGLHSPSVSHVAP
jgi:hypothetical protein